MSHTHKHGYRRAPLTKLVPRYGDCMARVPSSQQMRTVEFSQETKLDEMIIFNYIIHLI